MNGVVDPELVSRIDKNTLDELRRLQDNIDMIMQCAANPFWITEESETKWFKSKKKLFLKFSSLFSHKYFFNPHSKHIVSQQS